MQQILDIVGQVKTFFSGLKDLFSGFKDVLTVVSSSTK
ncbi:PorACj family cell wall channel-forming small protein [Corynebacterium bovis]|nr:PorACj family cell wall channel-forming small protein [Corynebacterium bovis]MDN8579013.1 PorACj family cell wall channel-forming small protein [Corynebacterium bovis]